MSEPTIYSTWTKFITHPEYSDYFLDNFTIWNNSLSELKVYLDTNKKRPSQINKNTKIKRLGLWCSTQIKNYAKKKKIMSDPTIYSAWTAFITHPGYKQYFE
jgi:hypothetical protein